MLYFYQKINFFLNKYRIKIKFEYLYQEEKNKRKMINV